MYKKIIKIMFILLLVIVILLSVFIGVLTVMSLTARKTTNEKYAMMRQNYYVYSNDEDGIFIVKFKLNDSRGSVRPIAWFDNGIEKQEYFLDTVGSINNPFYMSEGSNYKDRAKVVWGLSKDGQVLSLRLDNGTWPINSERIELNRVNPFEGELLYSNNMVFTYNETDIVFTYDNNVIKAEVTDDYNTIECDVIIEEKEDITDLVIINGETRVFEGKIIYEKCDFILDVEKNEINIPEEEMLRRNIEEQNES